MKRALLGSDYRTLWTTRLTVPVLDLRTFRGGLVPTEEGGGEQTRSLRFKDKSGREWQFRSVDKNGAGALPAELRETFIGALFRDQTSSGHPAGGVIVPPLLEAAGILHATPVLMRMPDDTLLGEFREKFAGMLGTLEERPNDGFAGSTDIVDTEDLVEALNRDPTARLDEAEYLAARLIDMMTGDWDRHRDQWRWARVGNRWRPIPRDRDAAFTRYDGFLLDLGRLLQPKLQNFNEDFPSLGGLTRNGARLDQRFLTGLERSGFDSVARTLTERLSDSVLAEAVRRMPPEFQPQHGPWLFHTLKSRREGLADAAARFYRRLSDVVDVVATDSGEEASIERESGGSTLVTITWQGNPVYRRRFLREETREVRIYLRGGNNRVKVEGDESSRPLIRIIDADDAAIVASDRGIRWYQDPVADPTNGRPVAEPSDSQPPPPPPPRPPPDRGVRQRFLPILGIAPDAGFVFGGTGWIDWYGFRRQPYGTRFELGGVFATTRGSGRIEASLTRQLQSSPVFFEVSAMGSGIESLRWYGFGNQTQPAGPSVFHRLRKNDVSGSVSLGLRLGEGDELRLGPVVRWSGTKVETGFNLTSFIGTDQPYGIRSFTMAGVALELELEERDRPHNAKAGAALRLRAEAYPRWLDTDSAVARVEAEGTVAFAPISIADRRPSLHLMAGAVRTWGKLPYFLAPTLGGPDRLRGYYRNRFAGDAAVYGSVELRLPVTRAKLLLPGEQGLFGFVDGGRVWVRGESSDTWHHTVGAGVWFSFLQQGFVMHLALARPDNRDEGNRLLFGIGFPF
jgi:hypothetical protein